MEIQKVEVIQIETPRFYGHVSGHVIVKVHVDDGPVGLGEASDYRVEDVAATRARYEELLKGRDATRIVEINELLRTSVTPHLASAIDLALYDLNGKAQGVPAYQLMGGKVRDRMYVCYPIFGWQVREDFERAMGYLERLHDLGHHLFRFYVSGDSALDDRFLTQVFGRFEDQLKLKSIDFSWRFTDWEVALRYGEDLRHHEPYHFEAPSKDMRTSAEFARRADLPTTWHIHDLRTGLQAIEMGACNAFNLACVSGGPTHIRRIFALAESAGVKCLIGTDQESTLGVSAQVSVGISVPNLELPCDPMGPVLYTTSPARERVRVEGSYLYPFEAPGLGVELDEDKLRELTVAAA
ncbi:mandelate racemase/muconate lactonizing enzyme family protein [Candidatus Latescibacterota bacterium]